ncbi:hypothetical protein DSO57_1039440 [Entomophthora muscae]|uniref:Uncharacterized protein n=1 Tax=Entomophthora muscae TaxID=34485 RepID=A0ACC2T9B6_9FUNG|nr:hypothetical protein DSO57_1039440 [Entomophthora muscae]
MERASEAATGFLRGDAETIKSKSTTWSSKRFFKGLQFLKLDKDLCLEILMAIWNFIGVERVDKVLKVSFGGKRDILPVT